MSWRDRLQAGRFRTADFEIDAHDQAGGRRLALHEYPLRDDPYAEDMGRKAREFTLECFVVGDDYMSARDALLDALEDNGPGLLVHPYRGTQRVSVQAYRLRESAREGGMATFSVTFVEAGRVAEPDISDDTAGAVESAADAATAAMQARFSKTFSVPGKPQFVADTAVSHLGDAVSDIRALSGNISAATSPISEFSAQLDSLGSALGTLIRTPSVLASQVVGVMVSLAGVATSVTGALNAYRTLWPFGNDAASVPTTTVPRLQQAANQAAVSNLIQGAATAEAARASAGIAFSSGNEAIALRELFTDQFDALLAADGSDDITDALIDLHAAVVRDLNTRAAKLPRTISFTPATTVPALVLAQRLYGDATRADDIVARNFVRHPGFVPGGVALEVLSAA